MSSCFQSQPCISYISYKKAIILAGVLQQQWVGGASLANSPRDFNTAKSAATRHECAPIPTVANREVTVAARRNGLPGQGRHKEQQTSRCWSIKRPGHGDGCPWGAQSWAPSPRYGLQKVLYKEQTTCYSRPELLPCICKCVCHASEAGKFQWLGYGCRPHPCPPSIRAHNHLTEMTLSSKGTHRSGRAEQRPGSRRALKWRWHKRVTKNAVQVPVCEPWPMSGTSPVPQCLQRRIVPLSHPEGRLHCHWPQDPGGKMWRL